MPGYITPCPPDYHLALDPWVTAAWIAVYALSAEAGLLALGLLWFTIRRTVPARATLSLLSVTGCALVAVALALWITQRNAQTCFYGDIRYTPERGARMAQAVATATAQANVALTVVIVLVVIGTVVTATTLIRGWRGSRRRRTAAPV